MAKDMLPSHVSSGGWLPESNFVYLKHFKIRSESSTKTQISTSKLSCLITLIRHIYLILQQTGYNRFSVGFHCTSRNRIEEVFLQECVKLVTDPKSKIRTYTKEHVRAEIVSSTSFK